MVPARRKRARQAGKNGSPVVLYLDRFSMYRFRRSHDFAAEKLADRLVAETNAQDRQPAGEPLYNAQRNPCVIRCSRAGRNKYAFGSQLVFYLIHGRLVVA